MDAVNYYMDVLKTSNVPDTLYRMTGERCIDRLRFVGRYGTAITVHKLLINRFPKEPKYRNQLAVTYLTINKIPEARQLLLETLTKWPNDGFAMVHYGFILKVNDNNLEKSIEYLQKGLESKAEGVVDGRFYFHLGDALTRLKRYEEANKVYDEGVMNKIFLSKYQRSLYNVDRLTGRPWWSKEQTPQYQQFYKTLETNFAKIRDEGLAVMNQKGYFQNEAENLRDVGEWKQFELFARGIKHKENCKKCPFTCKIVETLPDATGCRRGQVKFSVMHPGTHVWPHCGPTNCRLRVHLGLKVPSNTFIRVADDTRSWEEGKVFIFDDSFEHEVWHNGTEFRLVLIVDVWHPELTAREKSSLSAI